MTGGKGLSLATRDGSRPRRPSWAGCRAGRPAAWPRGGPGSVGLLFPDLGLSGDTEEESPLYVDQVIRGAERAATSAGDAVLIAATRTASGRELAFSVAGKTDGLVVMARSLSEPDIAILARSVPVVMLANHYLQDGPTSSGPTTAAGAGRSPRT